MFCWLLLFASAHADRIRLMKGGDVAALQIHHDVSRARRTIDLATYIWEPCSTIGRLLANDLRERAHRGVRVRVLLDAYVHPPNLRRDLTADFAADGIEVRYFNPRAAFEPMNNRRMHAKMIVVDRRRYYMGGRNVADDYFDMGQNNWIDRDVAVEGSSAAAAQRQFDMLWASDLVVKEDGGPSPDFLAWRSSCLTAIDTDRRLARVIASDGDRILREQPTHQCARVAPVTDEPDFYDAPGRLYVPGLALKSDQYQRKHTTRAVVDFINGAGALTAENYTFVPDGLLKTAVDAARDRGAPFTIYTNAVMDQPPLQYLKEQSVRQDAFGSVRVFELSALGSVALPWAMTPGTRQRPARWSIHTKAMTAGQLAGPRLDALVGSFNFDPRSYATNLESAVLVNDCPGFAAELEASINRLAEFYERDRDCAACRIKPEISLGDQIWGTLGRPLYEFAAPEAARRIHPSPR